MSEHEQRAEHADDPTPDEGLGSHVISILSLLMGGLFLLVYLLVRLSGMLVSQAAATGLGIENSNYILAIGVGLTVLGLGLQAHTIAEFFRQRRSMFALNSVLLAMLGFALLVLVNYVAAGQDTWRWDWTSEHIYSLSEESVNLAHSLKQDVRLLVILPQGDPLEDSLKILVDQYVSASPRITTTRLYPETMSPEKQKELQEELQVNFYADLIGVAVQAGRNTPDGFVALRSRHLRLQDLWEKEMSGGAMHQVNLGEQKISSAIVEVTSGKTPKVYFLEGHEEASFTDFQARDGLGGLGRILRSKSYDLAPLNLRQQKEVAVPKDADVLVLAGPRRTLGEAEVAAIEKYLDQGGDALLMLEPALHRTVAGQPRQFVPSGLEPYLRRYGVEPEDDTLMFLQQDPTTGRRYVQTKVLAMDFGQEADGKKGSEQHHGGHVIVDPIARQEGTIIVDTARPLKVNPGASGGAKVTELVRTSQEHADLLFRVHDYREATEDDLRPGGQATLAVAIEVPHTKQQETGEDKDAAQPPANPTRLVVIGDVDLANNEFVQTTRHHNLELIQNSIAWLTQAEDRIVGKASRPKSYRLDMQLGQVNFFSLLGLFGLPMIPIGMGVFVWLIRRK